MFSYIIGRRPVTRRLAHWLILSCVAVSASAREPSTPAVQAPVVSQPLPTPTQSPTIPALPAVTTQPAATQPAATQPALTQPVITQPVITQPVITQPVITQPVITQPVITQPVITQPVVTQPAIALPVATPPTAAQGSNDPIVHKIQAATERLELTVNTSRILTLDQPIPRLVVGNPELIQATPLSPTEVQIFAKKVGATQVNLFTDKGQIFSVDCIIYGDVRQLTDLLRTEFPTANISVKAIAEGHVLLTGYVDRSDHIAQIVQLAHTFFPNGGGNAADDRVISNIEVVGVQQILLKVKVAEVSRTKLRKLGMDWANIHGANFVVSSIGDVIASTQAIAGSAGIGNDTIRFGVVNGTSSFFGFIEALQQQDLVKILAEPDVATVSGRPAQFRAGGQVPYPSSTSINGVSVSYMDTGVTVDFLPIVLGNGNIRLEVRPVVRELDEAVSVQLAPGVFAPGFTERKVDTGVEMKPGQTLALAGLISQRTIANKTEFPWIGDLPYFGVPFRRTKNTVEDVELLIIVTPELVAATDCCETPKCLPGMHTDNPNDCELYLKGYFEVPSHGPCGPGGCPAPGMGPGCGPGVYEGGPSPMMNQGGSYEQIPSGQPTPAAPAPSSSSSYSSEQANASASSRNIRVAQAPAKTNLINSPATPANSSNRYNSPQRQDPRASSSPGATGKTPGYIGPVGYDVLN